MCFLVFLATEATRDYHRKWSTTRRQTNQSYSTNEDDRNLTLLAQLVYSEIQLSLHVLLIVFGLWKVYYERLVPSAIWTSSARHWENGKNVAPIRPAVRQDIRGCSFFLVDRFCFHLSRRSQYQTFALAQELGRSRIPDLMLYCTRRTNVCMHTEAKHLTFTDCSSTKCKSWMFWKSSLFYRWSDFQLYGLGCGRPCVSSWPVGQVNRTLSSRDLAAFHGILVSNDSQTIGSSIFSGVVN